MKFILAPVIALGLAASTAFAQITINTPPLAVVCEPLQITWTGGVQPYYLSITNGQDTTTIYATFTNIFGTSLTWLVDQAVVTPVGLTLHDSVGTPAQSASFTIQNGGTNNSCITSTTSVSYVSTGTTGSIPSSTGGNFLATSTQSTPNTASSGAAKTAKTGSSSTPSSTSSKSGASRVTGQVAAAGIIGAAMVALLG